MAAATKTDSESINVLVIGLGSLGSVYARVLESTGRVQVTAVARSNYDLYASGGVSLYTDCWGNSSGWKPHRLVKSQEEALSGDIQYDYCLLTTKSLPDVTPIEQLLGPAIESKKIGSWVIMQNGCEVEEDLYQAVKNSNTPIISTVAWVMTVTTPDGSIVTQKGQWCTLASGIYPPPGLSNGEVKGRDQAALDLWTSLIKDGNGVIHQTDRIDQIRFLKNLFNCAWSSFTGLTRTNPASWVGLSEDVVKPMKDMIREIVDVGYESGLLYDGMIQLNFGQPIKSRDQLASDIWTISLQLSVEGEAKGGSHRLSLLVDVEMGRPIEVEVIVGSVLRIAKRHGIKTPLLDYTYALMKGLQVELISQQSKK